MLNAIRLVTGGVFVCGSVFEESISAGHTVNCWCHV
jgi:hypothetical protein